jgi:hypothetical protein
MGFHICQSMHKLAKICVFWWLALFLGFPPPGKYNLSCLQWKQSENKRSQTAAKLISERGTPRTCAHQILTPDNKSSNGHDKAIHLRSSFQKSIRRYRSIHMKNRTSDSAIMLQRKTRRMIQR